MSRAARTSVLVAAALTMLGAASVSSTLTNEVEWTPDALYYHERVLELRGTPATVAMAEVFEGSLSNPLRRDAPFLEDPDWVNYSKRFYERRIAVPLAAAALYPLAGERSVLMIALVGYVVSMPLLFVFLRLHFSLAVASAGALLTLLLPPLHTFGTLPLTDSWGVALTLVALICATLALRDRALWTFGWIATLLIFGLTRESSFVVVLGILWIAVSRRSRRALLLGVTGLAAVCVAPLLWDVPLVEQMAYVFNGYQPVPDPSWSFVAQHYPEGVSDFVRSNIFWLRHGEWYTAAYFIGGVALLFALGRPRPREVTTSLMQAMTFAALAYLLLLPNFTEFRLELVFVPMAAYGLALLLKQVEEGIRVRRSPAITPT